MVISLVKIYHNISLYSLGKCESTAWHKCNVNDEGNLRKPCIWLSTGQQKLNRFQVYVDWRAVLPEKGSTRQR